MKCFVFTLTLIVMACSLMVGHSQTEQSVVSPCALTVAQSPAVRGVKVGMSAQELFALFPGSADKDWIKSAVAKADGYPNFGFAAFNLNPNEYSTTDRFAGISQYRIELFDGRILRYEVVYAYPPVGPKWTRVDDFIAKLAEGFNLPPVKDWAVDPNISYQKTLKCNGFEVRASILNFVGNLQVSLPDYFKTRMARQTEYEDKMRRTFKP